MQRIATRGPSWPLHDLAATRRLEAQALGADPPPPLMQRAGAAVAQLALALAPHAQCIRIVAGVGNNGGDGLEAAIALGCLGKHVEVVRVGPPASVDARAALDRARAAGVAIDPTDPRPLGPQDLAIDALLGLGASRPPEGPIAAAIKDLNALPCPVLAIDLPSGLQPDTGQPLGSACVRATHTLTLLTLKPGLFTGQGRDLAGSVWLDDLQCADVAEAPPSALLHAGTLDLPPRRHAQHKGSFGDVAVIGGAPGMVGAALLAGRAAHAAGAGRVFVQCLADAPPDHDMVRPELMLRHDWLRHQEPTALASATVVAGCGGGDAIRAALPALLAHARRLVLDADALNVIAADEMLQAPLRQRARRGAATVLTPHPLEAARLLELADGSAVQADRLGAARALAERWQCLVLLKGSGSVMAAPGRLPLINASGNAALASAGTGDVLAGWIGGLWAQQPGDTADEVAESAWRSAARAAWLHGAAAEAGSAPVLRAADLVERMAALR
ncbi:MAG: NAD(P)H-hydrate dehydratase [Piscinibacter sp.]|nr:NAD(P)H-hydrate dehydratase [Piscinibacter sp.]